MRIPSLSLCLPLPQASKCELGGKEALTRLGAWESKLAVAEAADGAGLAAPGGGEGMIPAMRSGL